MKIIKYKFLSEKTETEEILIDKEFRCSADNLEANEAIAKSEAYNGEYTIEDDGIEVVHTPTAQEDTDAMLVDHEYRLTMLELFTDVTI